MHLLGFHRVLIACAIVFFLGYGVLELVAWVRESAALSLVLATGAFTAAAVLGLYLSRLRRFLRLPDPPADGGTARPG